MFKRPFLFSREVDLLLPVLYATSNSFGLFVYLSWHSERLIEDHGLALHGDEPVGSSTIPFVNGLVIIARDVRNGDHGHELFYQAPV